MVSTEIDNTQDIIDSRDVIARLDYLGPDIEDVDPDDLDEYNALIELAEEGESLSDWQYGEVLVRDQMFEAVSPHGSAIASPPNARIVEGAGATLMPGLVEPHAHLSWPSSIDNIINAMKLPAEEHLLITAYNARVTLDHGYTSAYSAGSLGQRFEVALRDQINAGHLPGPRLRASSIENAPVGVPGVSASVKPCRCGAPDWPAVSPADPGCAVTGRRYGW